MTSQFKELGCAKPCSGRLATGLHRPTPPPSRRACLAGLSLLLLSACKARTKNMSLDVVLFSYLDRPIFDVVLNQTDIGVAGPWPFSGRGTMSGVVVPIGLQKISWRLDGPKGMAGNGSTVAAKNMPALQDLSQSAAYLGVHIYSDETVELIASQHYPDMSARGKEFDLHWRRRHSE